MIRLINSTSGLKPCKKRNQEGRTETLNLDDKNEGRTFGITGLYNPDARRCYGTSNIPHELAGIIGQTLTAMTEGGIRVGLDILRPELGAWDINNLCYAYTVIFFDKNELVAHDEVEIILSNRIHCRRSKDEEYVT